MCAMYHDHIKSSDYNLSIDGLDIIVEEITPNESFNRRETSRKSIIGGTQTVIRTNYLPRDYNVVCHFLIDPLYPDVYDNIFREWQSKPVEVISKDMGGKFNAECMLKKSPSDSPNYLRVEIQLVEIPSDKSLIPNDAVKIPTGSKIKVTSTRKTNKKSNKKSNKNSNKKNKNNKKKGGKVTKTNKKNK